MQKKDDSMLLYRVAKLYYLEDIPQTEIARIEKVSRSTVSRLLEKARSSGIVNIEVKLPSNVKAEAMGKELSARMQLHKAIIAPTAVSQNTHENELAILRDVVSAAAAHLPHLLAGCRTIGVGWGRSVYNTAVELPPVQTKEARIFVPLVNNFTSYQRFLQTSSIVSRFCEKFEAEGYYLNVSSFQRHQSTRTEDELNNIRQLYAYWDNLDAAIVSFSSPEELLHNEAYRGLWENSLDNLPPAKGRKRFEGMGQVLYEDGSFCEVNRDFDSVSLDLHRLKTIPNVICIGAGKGKADTLLFAGLGGLYKILIVDHLTAGIMLKRLRQQQD